MVQAHKRSDTEYNKRYDATVKHQMHDECCMHCGLDGDGYVLVRGIEVSCLIPPRHPSLCMHHIAVLLTFPILMLSSAAAMTTLHATTRSACSAQSSEMRRSSTMSTFSSGTAQCALQRCSLSREATLLKALL